MSAEAPLALVAALLAGSGLAGAALWQARAAHARLKALDAALREAEARGATQAQRLATLEALRDTSQLAEHAIATGTAVVKEVHKGIAEIPFSVLEAIPATREGAKVVRGLHDAISDGVYGAIASLNKAVGRELRKGVPLDSPGAAAANTASVLKPVSLPALEAARPIEPPAPPDDDPEPPEAEPRSPPGARWG